MGILIITWGFEYILVKNALAAFESLTLVFFKYLIGSVVIMAFKLKLDRQVIIRKKAIPMFIACAIFGDIGYFYFEYTSLDYLPISLITILLSFVPVMSILIERIMYKRRITGAMTAGVIVCILGVTLVIGADARELLSGRLIGYLLAFGAVSCWNAYNFITASLHEEYSSLTLTFYQQIFAILLLVPYAFTHMPELEYLNADIIGGVLYLGIISAGFGFYIQVKALHVIGVTPTAMFSNFMPLASTFFGWVFLEETISPMQFVGGAIIIASASAVIYEKEKVTRPDIAETGQTEH